MKREKKVPAESTSPNLDKANFADLYKVLREALFLIPSGLNTEEWKVDYCKNNCIEDFGVLYYGRQLMIVRFFDFPDYPERFVIVPTFCCNGFPDMFEDDAEKVLWLVLNEGGSSACRPRTSVMDEEVVCLKYDSRKFQAGDKNILLSSETGRYIKIGDETFTFREPYFLFTRKGEIGARGVWSPTQFRQMCQGKQIQVFGQNGKETTSVWKTLSEVIEHYIKGEEQEKQPFWNLYEHEPTANDIDYKKDAKVLSVSLWGKPVCHVSAVKEQGEYNHFIMYRDSDCHTTPEVKQETMNIIKDKLIELGKHVLYHQNQS